MHRILPLLLAGLVFLPRLLLMKRSTTSLMLVGVARRRRVAGGRPIFRIWETKTIG
jgi:hypothetical protein